MRKRRAPFEGYTRDNDMVAFWRMDSLSSPVTIPDGARFAGVTRNLLQGTTSVCLATTGLFGQLASGALEFGNDYYSSTSTGYDDTPTTRGPFTVALWYDFSTAPTGATTGVIEYASQSTATAQIRQHLGIALNSSSRTFVYTNRTGAVDTVNSETPVGMPVSGHLALSVSSAVAGTATATWYYNGLPIKQSGFSDTRSTVDSGASGRWGLAGTRGGTATPGNRATITLDEVAVWNKEHNRFKIAELYGSCLRSWDQNALESTNSHDMGVRVLIENASGDLVDVTDMQGANWLRSLNIAEEADSPITATISLVRRMARYADISPLKTDSEITNLIELRRRVVIQRAFIPTLWNIQGWEWETRFEGFIDAWDVDNDEISLTCVDKSAPLIDQFVLDQRSYDFYSTNPKMETHLQQIINDNVPALQRDTSTVTIGYKGGTPTVYTEAGTAASPIFIDASWNLRYNDVASGPVMSSLQSVADQIGAQVKFRFHEPWHEHRLEAYLPKRQQMLTLVAAAPVSGGIEVETREPHGFNVGSIASVYGTASLNFGGSVASVLDFYRIRLDGFTGGSTATETAGSLGFSRHLALSPEDIYAIRPVKNSITDIRNYAVVKYQRVDSAASWVVDVSTSAASSNLLFVTIPATEDVGDIDPERDGITFTIKNAATAALNGNWPGTIVGTRLIRSNLAVPGGLTTSGTAVFESEYVPFKRTFSVSTPSVSKYGLRPVAMYEGSNESINSFTEAKRVADALISDLAEPTTDLSIETRILDVSIGDMIELPEDPKGRWTGTLTSAVVGIRESYASGECVAEYSLRHTRPTGGNKWAERIRIIGAIGAPQNNKHDIIDDALRARLQGEMGRTFSMGWPRASRREMGLRDDVTEVHISTASGFIPGPDTLASRGRSNHISINQNPDGTALSPGTTYYIRFRGVDIFGNPSRITGINGATAATTLSVYVRYLDRRPEAMVTTCSVASTSYVGSTFTPWSLVFDNSSDAASLSFDRFDNFSLSSSLWRCPTTGHFAVTHRSFWLGANVKPGGPHVVGRVEHLNSSASLLGAYNLTVATAALFSDLARLSISAQVFCQSGDFLRVTHADRIASGMPFYDDTWMVRSTTATTNYAYTSFSLTSEA